MKLKGVVLTYPVCDWRSLLRPKEERLSYISLPYLPNLKLGFDYVRGFGVAKKRKRISIPWRATDTFYFDCSGAIQRLPTQLPGGAGVTSFLRRLYLDGRALMRLEIGVFTHPDRRFQVSQVVLEDVARWFWNHEVQATFRKRARRPDLPRRLLRKSLSLGDALPPVVQNFMERTSNSESLTKDSYELLEPHIQVVAEASIREIRDSDWAIDDDKQLWIRVQPIRVVKRAEPIDAIYLLHLPGYTSVDANFTRYRLVRAYLAALHADLELIGCLLRGCASGKVASVVAGEYIRDLVKSLRPVTDSAYPNHDLFVQLIGVLESEFHTNLISRLLLSLTTSNLPPDVKDEVATVLSPHRRPPSVPSPTPPPAKEQEAVKTFQARIVEALDLYAGFLRGSASESSRYDDSKFRASAVRKADAALEKLPAQLRSMPMVFVSIGGADGTELFRLLDRTGSKHGVLLEYSDASVEAARSEARKRGVSLEVFTGDAMDKLRDAMAYAVELRRSNAVAAIAVTAQAVLHELPTRSKDFTLNSYFATLLDADVVIGREPVRPHDWPDRILLSGKFKADGLIKLSNLVRQHNSGFNERRFEPQKVHDSGVILDSALAVETMTKVFYSEDFLYELQERVTSFSADGLLRALSLSFKPTHKCWKETTTSPSFERYWNAYELDALDPETQMIHFMPSTHAWYRAIRRSLRD